MLFNIGKEPDETLQSLIAQVTTAMQLCQNLHSSDGSYTLSKKDKELMIMMLIQALPAEFDSFTSALLLQNAIDKAKVIETFVTEESNSLHHSNQSAMLANRHIAGQALEDKYFLERAILCPQNNEVDEINDKVLKQFLGEERLNSSADSVTGEEKGDHYPLDFLNPIAMGVSA